MLLVERHFLKLYGGSFTENFYGLKRERVLRVRGGEIPRAQLGAAAQVRDTLKLRDSDVWRNLAVLVGLPYLKRKLDESYDIHAAQTGISGTPDGERMARVYSYAEKYPNEVEHTYSFVQILTACTASFAHGANDIG